MSWDMVSNSPSVSLLSGKQSNWNCLRMVTIKWKLPWKHLAQSRLLSCLCKRVSSNVHFQNPDSILNIFKQVGKVNCVHKHVFCSLPLFSTSNFSSHGLRTLTNTYQNQMGVNKAASPLGQEQVLGSLTKKRDKEKAAVLSKTKQRIRMG